MAALGCCLWLFAILSLLVAMLIGSMLGPAETNVMKRAGVWRWLDSYRGRRGMWWKGWNPAIHEGIPWGFTHADIPDLSGQTIVVTGGNGDNLGYWTAHHLAAKGATVVITCRSDAKCAPAAASLKRQTGGDVQTSVMDLSSFKSIRAGAADLLQRFPTIDSLVLNAGVALPPYTLSEDGYELQFATNHLGHFLLTDLLLPRLEAAADLGKIPTVVSVTSCAHLDGFPEGILTVEAMNDPALYARDPMAYYGQSKLANILFAQELALRRPRILVNSAHPGYVNTDLSRGGKEMIRPYLGSYADSLIDTAEGLLAWSPSDGALTQLYLAVSPEVKAKGITGRYFHPQARETEPDPHARNATMQRFLWDLSVDATGKP